MATTPAGRESGWGTASLVLASIPYAAVVGVAIAYLLGVRDNQGHIYAFSIPFFCYVTTAPVAAPMALGGFLREGRRHRFSRAAVALVLLPAIGFGIYALR